jgi:phosphonoacetaldehyde hydrolase
LELSKKPLSGIKAVIFDWAGTTVDFGSRAPTQVFIEMFRRRGIEITEAEARGPMGMAKREHIAEISRLPRVRDAWQLMYRELPCEADIDSIYREFLPLQKSTLANHCDLVPGLLEAIAFLRSRSIKIGSSTGYTRELMDVVVPLCKSAGYEPDVVVCSDEVSAGRPAPWLNFRVMELLNVYPASSVLIVDDTPIGIAAGRSAGALTVAVSDSGNAMGLSLGALEQLSTDQLLTRRSKIEKAFFDAGADFVIPSVMELPMLWLPDD